MLNIFPRAFVVYVERIKASPIRAGIIRLAVLIFYKPIGMFFEQLGFLHRCKGRKPKTCDHTVGVYRVCNNFHTVRKFIFVSGQPISDTFLISVVDLEAMKFRVLVCDTFKVAIYYLVAYAVVIIIPRRISATLWSLAWFDPNLCKILVKRAVILASDISQLQKLVVSEIYDVLQLF